MVEIFHSSQGTPFVSAQELYSKLKVTAPIQEWFQEMVDYGFAENVDYSCHHKNHLVKGEVVVEYKWAVKLDMAKHIAMIQKSALGREIREYLNFLDRKVQDGKLLSHEQIKALFEICKVLGYFTVQKYLEREHFDFFNKPKEWWKHRAKLLGYEKTDLEEMVKTIGIKYVNERQALFHIDRKKLLRAAIIDLFMAMGKGEEYAKNVARFAESIVVEIDPPIYDDTEMSLDFKSETERRTIEQLKVSDTPTLLLATF
jgi:phage anti-repressor protein